MIFFQTRLGKTLIWQTFSEKRESDFKTRKMCEDVVQRDSYSLQFVPDWFVTQEQLEIWTDDNDYCIDDELIGWYNRYKKRKGQKAKIKEELLPIAWYPYRAIDWCIPDEEKRPWK